MVSIWNQRLFSDLLFEVNSVFKKKEKKSLFWPFEIVSDFFKQVVLFIQH